MSEFTSKEDESIADNAEVENHVTITINNDNDESPHVSNTINSWC